ncbi:EF-hand domain-containing protein [Oxalobacteraceae bacterium A2-2]
MKTILMLLLAALAAAPALQAQTIQPPARPHPADPAPGAAPLDPYLPPEKRTPARERPAEGAALRQQAMDKLRQRFEEADLDASGSLSKAEAQKAGLGFVAQHFEQIDTRHSGKVSFADLQAYLQQRARDAARR